LTVQPEPRGGPGATRGPDIVHRPIDLEAPAGQAFSIQTTEQIAPPGLRPGDAIVSNDNTVGEPDGHHGEKQ
jgi:hypothetical protein